MEERDYFYIYLIIVIPATITASYFLEVDKGQDLRASIVFWSLIILGGML